MLPQQFSREPDPRDPVLDDEIVLGFVRRHLPNASAVTAIDETGGEARAYVIDEVYIFNTQRPHRVRPNTSLEKAAFHHNVIAQRAPEASVPRVLGYGREGDVEYLLMTRMPGVAVRNVVLEGEARRAVMFELGKTLRRIHSLELAPFEASGLFPGDKDGAEVYTRIENSLRRAAAGAIAVEGAVWDLEVRPEALAERALALVQDRERAALQANPGPEHVFVDPVSLRFQGLIDFGDAYISHPTFDFRRWSAPADRSALMEGYCAERDVSDAFLGTWRAVLVNGLMTTIAGLGFGAVRPERRQAALDDLRTLLPEL